MSTQQNLTASVIGVGTELTSGQILNRNGQWISQKLYKLGVATDIQMVVPDEKSLMLLSFATCMEKSDFIFITGGLGPTSDDFTRDVVADFLKLPMVFDQASWQHIEDRLKPRGIAVKEIQRQQCYFPEGAVILKNRMGTANGFYVKASLNGGSFHVKGAATGGGGGREKHFWILPGPPKEIEAIWDDWVATQLAGLTKHIDPIRTISWDVLGLPESEIAGKVSAFPEPKGLEYGYRVHLPYVEFKISGYKSVLDQQAQLLSSIENLLAPNTVARNGEDIIQGFVEKWLRFEKVVLHDAASGAYTLNRLTPYMRSHLSDKKFEFANSDGLLSADLKNQLSLRLIQHSPEIAEAFISYEGNQRSLKMTAPYKGLLLEERSAQYFGEMALVFWSQQLR